MFAKKNEQFLLFIYNLSLKKFQENLLTHFGVPKPWYSCNNRELIIDRNFGAFYINY